MTTLDVIPAGALCEHPDMVECHEGCGHFSCPSCGLFWDEGGSWFDEDIDPNDPEVWEHLEDDFTIKRSIEGSQLPLGTRGVEQGHVGDPNGSVLVNNQGRDDL